MNIGIFVTDGIDNSCLDSAGLSKSTAVLRHFVVELFLAAIGYIYVISHHKSTQLFEAHHIIHFVDRIGFMAFGQARSDEYDFGIRIFLLRVSGCIDHRAPGFRNIGFQHRSMLVHPTGISRATRGGHKSLAFLHFFFQFFGFVCSCDFGTESNFDHIVETDLFDRCQYLPRSGIELPIDSRSRDSYDFFLRITNTFVYIDDFRPFHDSSIGTGLHTFSAIDTLFFIDMFYAFGIFTDRFYGTNVFARNRRVYNSMIGANFLA